MPEHPKYLPEELSDLPCTSCGLRLRLRRRLDHVSAGVEQFLTMLAQPGSKMHAAETEAEAEAEEAEGEEEMQPKS